MIKLIVTDLDNTLYDWVGYFVPAFNSMLEELASSTGMHQDELIPAFRRVHRERGTTEYALAIAELDVLAELDDSLSLEERLAKYEPAVRAFRRKRHETLRLYTGVRETLERLRADGRLVVAHTDAMRSYVLARVRELGHRGAAGRTLGAWRP